MEEVIEARVSPTIVWEAWVKAHQLHCQKGIEAGQNGYSKAEGKSKFRYKILNVKPGESFSILWKTLFVRLIFTHTVTPTQRGAEIRYRVQIQGLFAWAVRWLLGNKIKTNIGHVLKAMVKQLENVYHS